jgi:predicted nuclease of predicted toxin-antitoxin system
MTKLLLDQGLPRSTGTILCTAGWDVTHVSEVDLERNADWRRIFDGDFNDKRICAGLEILLKQKIWQR